MSALAARAAVDSDAKGGEVAKEEMVLTRRFLEACGAGDLEALKRLLFEELNEEGQAHLRVKKTRDATGKSAMHFAAAAGQAETCAFLYRLVCDNLGANQAKELANAVDEDGSTPLSLCAAAAPAESVVSTSQTLLDFGADPHIANHRGVGPLHRAAGEGHCEVISLLLDRAPDDTKNHSEMTQTKARMINVTSEETGSPLHWAAGEKRVAAVRLLVDRGAELDVPNSAGLAPILLAAAVGCGEAVAVLAEAGASLDVELPGGINLLHICAEMQDPEQAATGIRSVLAAMDKAEKERACAQKYDDQGLRKGLYAVELAARTGNRAAVELLREASSQTVLQSVVGGDSDTSVEAIVKAAAKAKSLEDEAVKKAELEGSGSHDDSQQHASSAPMSVLLPSLTRKAKTEEDATKAEEQKGEGNNHFRAGRVEDAIASYSKGLEYDGANHVLWGNRCACYLRLKNYDAAVFDASAALHVKPDWLKARVRLGKAFMGLKRYEDAAVALWEVVQKEKDQDTKDTVDALFQKAIRLGRKQHKAKMTGR